jgi:hypothetical protein
MLHLLDKSGLETLLLIYSFVQSTAATELEKAALSLDMFDILFLHTLLSPCVPRGQLTNLKKLEMRDCHCTVPTELYVLVCIY